MEKAYIPELPSHVWENIFEYLPTSNLKTMSLVCWQWHNEIAMVLKKRTFIYLDDVKLNQHRFTNTLQVLVKSGRYFENIKISFDCLRNSKFTKRLIKSIQAIRNRDSLKYKNNIKNVIFIVSTFRPPREPLIFVDVFSALGNELLSIDFQTSDTKSEWNLTKLIGDELKACKDCMKNLTDLRLSVIGLQKIATFCTNLRTLSMCMANAEEDNIFNQVVSQNVNIQNLHLHVSSSSFNTESIYSLKCLTSLELDGVGAALELLQKTLMGFKSNILDRLVINNCVLDSSDFKAMQLNFQSLRKLHLKTTHTIQRLRVDYCWGLQNLKELKVEVNYVTADIDCEFQKNECLEDLSFNKTVVISKVFLQNCINSTPHLKKVSFVKVRFDFSVDVLFDLLENLRCLEELTFDEVRIDLVTTSSMKISILPKLKNMKIHFAFMKHQLMTSRTFKVMRAVNLETLMISNWNDTICKSVIDEIPKLCVNLKKVTFVSPEMLREETFQSICEKYPQLTEFHYLYGGDESDRTDINCDTLKNGIQKIFSIFEKSEKLKYAHICYNAKTTIKCRCPRKDFTLGCLWSFRKYMKGLCKDSDFSFDLKTEQPEPGLTKFTISNGDKVLQLSTSGWRIV